MPQLCGRRGILATLTSLTIGTGLPAARTARGDAASPISPPIAATARLWREALAKPAPRTYEVISALRGADDPALLPIFEQARHSKDARVAILGILAANFVTQNPATIPMHRLLHAKHPNLWGGALAGLLIHGHMSQQQLVKIAAQAPLAWYRLHAVAALVQRGLQVRPAVLERLAANTHRSVRYHAALVMLETHQPVLLKQGLKILQTLAQRHDARSVQLQFLTLLPISDHKIVAAEPFVRRLAGPEDPSPALRRAAVNLLLSLHDPSAGKLLRAVVSAKLPLIYQLQLALMCIANARDLKAADIAPLFRSKSHLVKAIVRVAQDAIERHGRQAALLKLIGRGQPFIMNWALTYAHVTRSAALQIAVDKSLIRFAAIVDGQRDQDFVRAITAAQQIANDTLATVPAPDIGARGTAKRRKNPHYFPTAANTLSKLLMSPHRAVVESVLEGMRPIATPLTANLVLKVWPRLMAMPDRRIRQFAALIVAQAGHRRALPILARIIRGEADQNAGVRALAGYYYATLCGQKKLLISLATAPAGK